MSVLVHLVLLLCLSGHSCATYCICKDGVSEKALQTTIDYACGAGADCSSIHEKGGCYEPNTVKDHCNYAANSYFQRKGQAVGSCDFSGTATTSATIPNQASGCVYPASPSTAGTSTTPSTFNSPTMTNTTGGAIPVFGSNGMGIDDTSAAVGLFQRFSLAFSLSLFMLFAVMMLMMK
ncbi:hypothetical protein SAY86_002642 [Trapa natans]|uniref:X8 domain-containing protein n=1 Tax=Trapa natans TaxID=22666 RepID=A0AAN7LDL6_TRANT|nr:hypothetical protein SAY86_002642 [Trapa natans]